MVVHTRLTEEQAARLEHCKQAVAELNETLGPIYRAKPFLAGSPLSSVLKLGDMGLPKGKYEIRRFNEFAHTALTSHNTGLASLAEPEAIIFRLPAIAGEEAAIALRQLS